MPLNRIYICMIDEMVQAIFALTSHPLVVRVKTSNPLVSIIARFHNSKYG
ncbi:hypothetical protein DESC_390038 [Desulfosarcina cetonica]|nr:hypothetical protein DESC_390038 [Desulfosarcina cetonica]